jgi:hypothetical protein
MWHKLQLQNNCNFAYPRDILKIVSILYIGSSSNNNNNVSPRDMICLGNMCIDTLHIEDDDDGNNNNNNNNNGNNKSNNSQDIWRLSLTF